MQAARSGAYLRFCGDRIANRSGWPFRYSIFEFHFLSTLQVSIYNIPHPPACVKHKIRPPQKPRKYSGPGRFCEISTVCRLSRRGFSSSVPATAPNPPTHPSRRSRIEYPSGRPVRFSVRLSAAGLTFRPFPFYPPLAQKPDLLDTLSI